MEQVRPRGRHCRGVARNHWQRMPRRHTGYIPDQDCRVVAARCQRAAVWSERQPSNPGIVSPEPLHAHAPEDVPEVKRTVRVDYGQPAPVWRELQALVPTIPGRIEATPLLSTRQLPESNPLPVA